MKKILVIVTLGLLICGKVNSEIIKYSPSDLIKAGYTLTHVTQTTHQTVLIYTFVKEVRGLNEYTDHIVSCHIALDKKNRTTCYTVADYDKSTLKE